jgi:hypothetical protein
MVIASIHSQDEFDKVATLTSSSRHFLGGIETPNEIWTWEDGTEMDWIPSGW